MYRKEEDHLIAEKYEQVNELFGKQHLNLIGNWFKKGFGSVRGRQAVENIKQANKLVNQMKKDSVNDGVDFNFLDPEWVYGWSKERLGFDPSDYEVKYFTGENQSKFIQDALAARSKFLRTRRANMAKPTSATSDVGDKDKITNIVNRWPFLSKKERNDIFISLSDDEVKRLEVLLPKAKRDKTVESLPTEDELE